MNLFLAILYILLGPDIYASVQVKDRTISAAELAKIDPTLRAVLAEEWPNFGISTEAPPAVPLSTDADGVPIYGVIIYTTQPDSLGAAGIAVDSVLPGFVTARVRPAEVMKLARMPWVRAVKASTSEEIGPPVQKTMRVSGETYDLSDACAGDTVTDRLGGRGTVAFGFDIPAYCPSKGADNDYLKLEIESDGCITITLITPKGLKLSDGSDPETGAVGLKVEKVISRIRSTKIWLFDREEANPPAEGPWRLNLENNGDAELEFRLFAKEIQLGDRNRQIRFYKLNERFNLQ